MAIQAGLIRVQWPPPWPPSLILTSGDWEAPCSLTGDSNSWNYYQFSGWGYIGPNKTVKTKTILIKDFRIAHWHCMPSHSSSRTTRSHENFQKLLCLIYCSNNSDIAENAGLLSAPVRGYWPLIGWEWSRDLEPGLWLVSTRAWSKEEARSAGLFSPGEFSDNQLASLFSFCLFIKH